MIKFRRIPFSETSVDIPYVAREKADELVRRVLVTQGYAEPERYEDFFHVVVNGFPVEKEYWKYVIIREKDSILVTPKLARGEGAQLFKIIAVAVVAIVVSAATANPGVGGAVASALYTAGAVIGTTLLLNAIIPPPDTGLGSIGTGSSYESSQMYSITGQSNAAKKLGKVPKVYGIHRIFPIVAANPYTEIEADPGTGELVQYFYGVYDFGFGPAAISDIKIGDTFIDDYADAQYRLVDFNKPAVNEGPWDEVLYSDLLFYKGDVERDGTSVALDKNQSAGGPLDDYQAVRNASSNVQGNDQEISLDFVCPAGLIAYGTDGTTSTRNIDIQIEFSKVGEDNWKAYNDPEFVKDFTAAGGTDQVFVETYVNSAPILLDNDLTPDKNPFNDAFGNPSSYDYPSLYPIVLEGNAGGGKNPSSRAYIWVFGYPVGNQQYLLRNGDLLVGDYLTFRGTPLGRVTEITPHPTLTQYSYYRTDTTNPVAIVLYQVKLNIQYPSRTFAWSEPREITLDSISVLAQSNVESEIIGSFTRKRLTLGAGRIAGRTTTQIYATYKFKPKEIAAYKVRVTRVTSFSASNYQIQDRLSLVSISTRFDRKPILTEKRHVFIEVRIRATNQLNGAIQNLSAIASSVLDVWNPETETWEKQVSNNPAWVFADLLTGEVNPKAIDKSRLNVESLVEWANFCAEIPPYKEEYQYDTPRYESNFVLDFDTGLQGILSSVSGACQASLNIVDGKYGVLLDVKKTVPVQVFTPRNSWGFSSSRIYNEPPHALKVQYVDPGLKWEVGEAVVYDNGFDVNNATEFDELNTFACTNYAQAWRFGRYMMAQAKLRRENISINVDMENLVCTRGDFVQLSQDVMRVGGSPARVKTVIGTTITIDDAIDTIGSLSYGYVYRGVSGIKTSTLTVINSTTFQLAGDIPAVGDLIVIGEVGKIVIDCLVKSITPNGDLTASLILVEKADLIYDYESDTMLPGTYDPQLSQNLDSQLAAPPAIQDLVVVTNTWRVVGAGYQYYIGIDWEIPAGSAYDIFEIYVDSGKGYNLVDFTKETLYEYIVDPANLNIPHKFKVLAVSATGKKINLAEAPFVEATPLRKITAPSDVESLFINITNEVISFEWTSIPDPDTLEYLIRYSPRVEGASWEASIPLLRADRNTTVASTQGRVGTYFIKAVDFNRNQSLLPAIAITSIPNLFDLNVIEETNDFPLLEGEKVAVINDGSSLMLKKKIAGGVESNEYFEEGFYYYKNFLDLGDIYTVRLQSQIEAEGFTVGDLMSNWPDLSSLLAMSNAGESDWDVETYYRATDSFNVMSEWTSLSDVDPISEGVQDNWKEWKKFTIGDATGRIFQFRLRLLSNKPSVTPRVFEGMIKADMPDRLESYNNVVVPVDGITITYSPAFKGPGNSPNIQITQDDAEQGDYYKITDKTLNGFKITFYDETNTSVERQADISVKGYGRKAASAI